MQENELRIFISSTFRDLLEEREHLIKKIFPELRAIARERGVTLTEVDLRWGLTHEDQILGQVIRTCLEEVDRCRPYFIGITGERYGYSPELHEVHKDGELPSRYPWIEDAVIDGASLIDMEFRYGALDRVWGSGYRVSGSGDHLSTADLESQSPIPDTRNPIPGTRARFFFRRERRDLDGGALSKEREKLEALKDRVRAAALPVAEFRDPISLGEMVYDHILEILRTDFSHIKPPTPLGEERAKHEAFAASRRVAYIPNAAYLKRLNDWVKSDEPPLVVYAESGSGKSSLVAYWAEQMRRKAKKDEGGRMKDEGRDTSSPHPPSSLILHPSSFPPRVIEHYVGIGATSTDHFAIMRHIMREIKDMMGRDDEIPAKPEELERAFANWLGFTLDTPFVIIMDGINQLTGSALELSWIPPQIPKNIRLIITSTVEATLIDLRERGWKTLGMQPLSEKEREAIVVRFLGDYHKALPPDQVSRIAQDLKCAHPLFLRTLLEELRLFGHHGALGSEIDRYLDTTGTEDLFQVVLERIEEDFGARVVRDAMSFIWASRGGLTEAELVELCNSSRLKISSLIKGLDYHLVEREGHFTFFHDYLRRAVEKRYLKDAEKRRTRYLALADYFEHSTFSSPPRGERPGEGESRAADTPPPAPPHEGEGSNVYPLRLAREIVHTLSGAEQPERLARALANIPIFLALWDAGTSDVLELWEQLSKQGHEPQKNYSASLDPLRKSGSTLLPDALQKLNDLFRYRSANDLSAQLLAELLTWASEHSDAKRAMEAERGLGNIDRLGGDFDEAMLHLNRSLEIAESLGDKNGMSKAIGSMGNVHLDQCRYAEALESYERSREMAEATDDKVQMSVCIANMGQVHIDQGRYDEALACFERALEYAESLGNKSGMSAAIGSMGIVHWNQGRYTEAARCFEQQQEICEVVGDKRGVSSAIGFMGLVHMDQGRYAEALQCYERSRKMAEAMDDKVQMSIFIGNMGYVHLAEDRYEDALAVFRKALAGHLAVGFLIYATYWLSGIAAAQLELAEGEPIDHREARENAEECVRISQEIGKPDTLFLGRVLLARIDAAEGNAQLATEKLEAMLAESGAGAALHADEEQIADLHYWLWKISESGVARNGISHPANTQDREVPLRATQAEEALWRYEALCTRIPKFDFRKRIAELKGEHVPKSADDVE